MKKIIVVTKNWVGDILFEFPAIEAIKKNNPDSKIACLAPARCHELLANHPDIDQVILFDERNEHKSFWSRLEFILRLRREKWDEAYLFHRSRTRASILFFGGVRKRVGFGGLRRLFLSHVVPEPEPIFHQVDHFMKMLDGVGIPYPPEPAYRYYFTLEDAERADQIAAAHELEKFVCFHLGANWEPKRWPPESFAALADLIYEKWKIRVVVTGAPRDRPLFEQMKSFVKKAEVTCLVGKTNLGELGALFKKSLFVVSGDSGPLHVASGVGAPTIALFGPTNPDLTGPRGIGEKEVIWFVPEGFKAPFYGEEFPKEGWIAHIKPTEVCQRIEALGWAERDQSTAEKLSESTQTTKKKYSPPTKRSKILMITLSNIGDVILTLPVLMHLKASFPDSEISVICGPKTHKLLKPSCFIDELIVYDKKSSLSEKKAMIENLRKNRFDFTVDLRHTMIPYLIRAKKRSPMIRKFKSENMRERHLEILEKMSIRPTEKKIEDFDYFHEEEEKSVLEKLNLKGVLTTKDWIVVAPIAASELKTWRLEGFSEVIKSLLETRSENILLVGDTRERKKVEELCALNPSRVFSMAGQTTLRELAALLSRSQILITNDSAVMHLGYELNLPVVAIFGPTSPIKYGHFGARFKAVYEDADCVPCEQPRCRLERQICFEDLTSQKVLSACEELLCENISSH